MSDDGSQQPLLSDSALTDPQSDNLGYSEFAESLSQAVHSRSPPESIVIGLYGPWGSGKSSILNFIEHYLIETEENPTIIRFNPWWFSGQADLIDKFFSQVGSGLSRGEDVSDIRNKLSRYTSAVSNLPFTAATGVPAGPFLKVLSTALETEVPNIEELKESISEELEELDYRIYIFIDDIDRLTQREIKQMFRLINSVADFPNTTYVLAFDYNIVSEALEGERGVSNGQEYLDKIIQLPKSIPVPREDSIGDFFAARLEVTLEREDSIFDIEHWQRIFGKGILPLLDTPRDAVRLSNAVDSASLAYSRDINFVDLVCLEALRLFCRDVYILIRDNPEKFVGPKSRNRLSTYDVDYEELFAPLESNENIENAKSIVAYLFPRTRQNSFSRFRIRENRETYRRRRRICDPETINYYLRQVVPGSELGIDEFESLLSIDNDKEYASLLVSLTEQGKDHRRTKANQFLNQVEIDEIEYQNEFFRGLFIAGDDLMQVDPSSNELDRSSKWSIEQLLVDRLDLMPQDQRGDLLAEAISEGDSVYLPVFYLGAALREHGIGGGDPEPLDEDQQRLSSSQIEELKKITISKIERAAEQNQLKNAPHLDRILVKWNDWSEDQPATEWLNKITADDDHLFAVLGAFLSRSSYSSQSESGTQLFVDLEYPGRLIDLPTLRELVNDVDTDDLEGGQKELIRIYRKGFELHDAGAATNDPTTWRTSQRILNSEEQGDSDEE
jgi:predicted KAP-like P-loop ATPase